MIRPRRRPTDRTAQARPPRISKLGPGANWRTAGLPSICSSVESAQKRSLGTCDDLLLSEGLRCEAHIRNPQFASNRVSGRHSLNSKHQQFRLGSGAECSFNLFPLIRVFKVVAGEVFSAGELIFEHEARSACAF